MRHIASLALSCLLALCGCSSQTRLQIDAFKALAKCSAPTSGGEISTSVLPLQIPPELSFPGSTTGTLARRIVVTFAPGSLQRGDSLLWTRLSLRTLGGTLAGWTQVRSHGVSIDLASPSGAGKRRASTASEELAAIDSGAGYITVERLARTPRNVSSALSLDLLIAPGGVPVDEPVVRIQKLWRDDGGALPPDALQIDLVPVRHAPGDDGVDADIQLDFVVAHERGGADRVMPCRSSAQARATLVDKDAVRPALWDLGVSSLNAPRTRWLALSSPTLGVVRAVFESPEAATSFGNWIRATQSLQAGTYRLGLFERSGRRALRPFVPVDLSSTETFRPLTPEEARGLRVGPLGEP